MVLAMLMTSIMNTATPHAEVKVLDGAALVDILSVCESRNFGEYAAEVLLPYVTQN